MRVKTAPHWRDATGLVTEQGDRVAWQSATGCWSRQRWEPSRVGQRSRGEAVGIHPDAPHQDPRARPFCHGKNRLARCQ